MGKLVISGLELTDALKVGGPALETSKLQYKCLSCGKTLNKERFYKQIHRQYFAQLPECACGHSDWEVSYASESMI